MGLNHKKGSGKIKKNILLWLPRLLLKTRERDYISLSLRVWLKNQKKKFETEHEKNGVLVATPLHPKGEKGSTPFRDNVPNPKKK